MKKTFAISCLLLLLSVAFLAWRANDPHFVREIIGQELEEQFHQKIKIGSIEWDFSQGIGVSLKKILIRGEDQTTKEFFADGIWVTLDWLSLLKKEILFKKVILDGIAIDLIRGNDGHVYWTENNDPQNLYLHEDSLQSKVNLGTAFEISVKNSELNWTDLSQTGEPGSPPVTLQIANLSLNLKKTQFWEPLQFVIDGSLPASESTNSFHAEGQIRGSAQDWDFSKLWVEGDAKVDRIQLAADNRWMKKIFALSPGPLRISVDSHFSGTMHGQFASKGEIRIFPERAGKNRNRTKLERINYDVAYHQDTLKFNELEYLADDFELKVKGQYSGFNLENPKVQLSLTTSNFHIEKTHQILPFQLFFEKTHRSLHKRFKSGKLKIRNFEFDGSLSQLNHLAAPENLKHLQADLSLEGIDLGLELPRLKNVNGELRIDRGISDLNIDQAHFEGLSITRLSGKIHDLLGRPQVNWDITGNLNLASLFQTLKNKKNEEKNEKLLHSIKQIEGDGAFQLNLSGPIDAPETLVIAGEIAVLGGIFQTIGMPNAAKDLAGKIFFSREVNAPNESAQPVPWNVHFADFSGQLAGQSLSQVHIKTNLTKDESSYQVQGKISIESPLELKYKWPDSMRGRPTSYLEETTIAEGEIFFDLSMGDFLSASASLPKSGSLKLSELFLINEKSHRPIKNLSGLVVIEKDVIQIKKAHAEYGDSPVDLNADFKLAGNATDWTVELSSSQFRHSDLPPSKIAKSYPYEGPAKINLAYRKTADKQQFYSQMDLTNTDYKIKGSFHKKMGLSNLVYLQGEIFKDQQIKIDLLSYDLNGNKISGHGSIQSIDDPFFFLQMNAKALEASPFLQCLEDKGIFHDGNIDFELSADGHADDLSETRWTGQIDINRFHLKPHNFAKTVVLRATLGVQGKQFSIDRGKLESGDSNFSFGGTWFGGPSPHFDFKISDGKLDLNDLTTFLSLEGKESPSIFQSDKIRQLSGQLSIDADKIFFADGSFKDVSAEFKLGNAKLDIQRFDLNRNGESLVQTKGQVDWTDPEDPSFESLIIARDIPAEALIELLGKDFKGGLSGDLHWLKLKLRSHFSSLSSFFKKLNGEVTLDVRKGKINTDRLLIGLNRLLKLEEDISDENQSAPYILSQGHFKIVDGVANTENFVFEDLEQRMSLIGDFDLNVQSMDIYVGVAPMHELDQLITKIPIVGRILTAGSEKSVFKNYFHIKGPFADPDANPLPLTSLSKKILGTLQEILLTPGKLILPSVQ